MWTAPSAEQFSWELERFCELALRANPNILECLHSPLVASWTTPGRNCWPCAPPSCPGASTRAFTRYAMGQLRKLEADVRTHGAPRWKHAMHLLRLLISARDLLRTGELRVEVGDHRERLLAVKRGEVGWSETESWMSRLHEEAAAAASRSPLPDEPDRARVEDFLFRVRRASAAVAVPERTEGQ